VKSLGVSGSLESCKQSVQSRNTAHAFVEPVFHGNPRNTEYSGGIWGIKENKTRTKTIFICSSSAATAGPRGLGGEKNHQVFDDITAALIPLPSRSGSQPKHSRPAAVLRHTRIASALLFKGLEES